LRNALEISKAFSEHNIEAVIHSSLAFSS